MELIPYKEFAQLRLKQFCSPDIELFESDGYEWMDGIWICESIGFTTVVRLRDMPDEAGGLDIDFSECPESAACAILRTVHLPLYSGMTFEAVHSVLGEPEQTEVFVSDRKSYDFAVGACYPYHISCTIHDLKGLIYLTVIRKDVLSKINATQPGAAANSHPWLRHGRL